MGCGVHKRFKLDVMPVIHPPSSSFWSATTALELARGAAVAGAENMTALDKELFYMGTSSAIVELRLAEPTDDHLVTAMLKMIEECPERKQAFVEDSRVPLKCSTTANAEKAARKVRIAERVRASLDNKSLQDEETIIVGGINAKRFADALGLSVKSAATSLELRSFLTSHFAASVKRVFVWMDLPDSAVVAEVFISNIVAEVKGAAAWAHVVFCVLPPPFNDIRLDEFESFMRHFNKASPELSNVCSLDGYRFSHALGSNEIVTDHSAIYLDGTISSKGAGAAIKFLTNYCDWLFIEKHDKDAQQQGPSDEDSLHGVRGGKIAKNAARGAPSRGGGGQRGRGFQPNFQRVRGNQPNYGHRRGFY
ncbi:hypothetical protein AAVH_09089 [Aphelenchoides avenae]|nr:hypothetical protein AAVH_09089 [Aphelenchus avenae]